MGRPLTRWRARDVLSDFLRGEAGCERPGPDAPVYHASLAEYFLLLPRIYIYIRLSLARARARGQVPFSGYMKEGGERKGRSHNRTGPNAARMALSIFMASNVVNNGPGT